MNATLSLCDAALANHAGICSIQVVQWSINNRFRLGMKYTTNQQTLVSAPWVSWGFKWCCVMNNTSSMKHLYSFRWKKKNRKKRKKEKLPALIQSILMSFSETQNLTSQQVRVAGKKSNFNRKKATCQGHMGPTSVYSWPGRGGEGVMTVVFIFLVGVCPPCSYLCMQIGVCGTWRRVGCCLQFPADLLIIQKGPI